MTSDNSHYSIVKDLLQLTSGVAKTPKIQHSTSIACFECSTSGGQSETNRFGVSNLVAPRTRSVCLTLEIICSSSSRVIARQMVEARGFEPLTSGLQSPRSAKLSYAPLLKSPFGDFKSHRWVAGAGFAPETFG